MIDFSVCIETAFAEGNPSFPDRVRGAAKAGFPAVEIWEWWTKPLPELRHALLDTGTELHTLCVETWQDKCQLGDPTSQSVFLERVKRAAAVAIDLGTPKLVVLAGDRVDGRSEAAQHDALLETLAAAATAIAGSGLQLLLEIVNREFEGPNALLQDTQTTLRLLRSLNHPQVRFLYDRYHAILNGESLGWGVEGNMDLVGHIQVADVPGRHEFGTGNIDWAAELSWLGPAAYQGLVGIEAIPLCDSSSLYEGAKHTLAAAIHRAAPTKQD
ncbi:MAG: TIM barrel protein [Cypionkella sp.]